MKIHEVTVDLRGMCSLRFRVHKVTRYLAEESPDGVITLTPAAMVPARIRVTEPAGELEGGRR